MRYRRATLTNDYTARSGFHHASTGVAACWYGGALALTEALTERAAAEDCDPYVRAHLGAVERDLCAARAVLRLAAGAVDQDPEDREGSAATRALSARSVVAAACWSVIQHTDKALGTGADDAGPWQARASTDLGPACRAAPGGGRSGQARRARLPPGAGVPGQSAGACRPGALTCVHPMPVPRP